MHKVWASLYKGTPAEHAIEPAVASMGVRYRTQFPFFLYHGNDVPFFADFALIDYRVVIEVDDEGHMSPEQIEKDYQRSQRLKEIGWVVVRCTNEDAISHPVATVNRMMTQLGLTLRATSQLDRGAPSPLVAPAVPTASRSYGPGSGSARRRSPARNSRRRSPGGPRSRSR